MKVLKGETGMQKAYSLWALVGAFGLSMVAVTQTDASAQPAKAKPPAKSAKPAASASAAPSAATTASASASAATTASPLATGSAAGPSAAAPVAMDGATYGVRLRDLESRVDELKDQIRRSHTRLSLLSDTIMSGGMAGSRSEVLFRNEMSSAFRVVRAMFIIDGAVQYNKQDDSGALADQKEIPIFTGAVPAGDHTVQVLLTLQGNGYGVFTYLRGYKFEVKSSHSFTAVEGKMLNLVATALEKGGVTTPLEQRPGIEWQEKLAPINAASGIGPQPAGAAPKASVSVGSGK
jgi:hypothetical protein